MNIFRRIFGHRFRHEIKGSFGTFRYLVCVFRFKGCVRCDVKRGTEAHCRQFLHCSSADPIARNNGQAMCSSWMFDHLRSKCQSILQIQLYASDGQKNCRGLETNGVTLLNILYFAAIISKKTALRPKHYWPKGSVLLGNHA